MKVKYELFNFELSDFVPNMNTVSQKVKDEFIL